MKLFDVKTRALDPIDDEEQLHQALLTGTHSFESGSRVQVLSPDGELGSVPSENVADAIRQGYRVETPSQAAVRQYVDDNQGLKGALKVGLGQAADEAALGLPELVFKHKGDPLEVAKWEALKKEHELANNLGGIAGFGASLFTGAPLWKGAAKAGESVAAHLAEKAVVAAGEELGKRTAQSAAASVLRNMAAKGAGAATEGAIASMPHAITETALGDPEAAAETLVAGAGIGMLLGGGGALAKDMLKLGKEATLKGVSMVTQQEETAKSLARKVAKVLTGVNEDDVLHYVQNADRVNAAPAREELENMIDASIAKLEASATGAKEKLLQARQDAKDAARALYVDKTAGAPDMEAIQKLVGTTNEQKVALGSLSEQAEDELLRANLKFSKKDIERLVDAQVEKLRVGGRGGLTESQIEELVEEFGDDVVKQVVNNGAIIGETNKAAEAYLLGLRRDLDQLPDVLTGGEVRQIMRGLRMDAQKSWDRGAGAFDAIKERLVKSVSEPLSDRLKAEVPGYAAYMDRMSAISKNLSKASKLFRNEQTAANTLNRMFTTKGTFDRQVVEEMGALTGQDLLAPLTRYQESAALKELAKKGGDLGEVLVPELTAKVKTLEAELARAEEALEPIRRLGPGRTQAIIRNQGFKNANNKDRKALELLSARDGVDYNMLIKDRNVLDAFAKESPNGSRRTLLGTVLGNLTGGIVGGAIGGTIGATTDVYGGAMLKKLIDTNRNVSGLLFSEKAMKRAAEKLDVIPATLKTMGEKASKRKLRPASVNAISRLIGGTSVGLSARSDTPEDRVPPRKERIEDLKKLREQTAQWAANPEGMAERISALAAPVSSGGAPMIGEAYVRKMTAAVDYLNRVMPKPPRPTSPFAPKVEWKPTDFDLAAFEQKCQVIDDPFSVLDELADGTLTQNHMDALKAVYPGVFKMIQQKVQEAVVSGVDPLPYTERVKLSLLVDAPLDTSLDAAAITYYQGAFAAPDQTEEPKAGGGVKASVDVAGGYMTDNERRSERKS